MQSKTMADTSIWIDYIRNGLRQDEFISLIEEEQLLICEPVIVEIYAGLKKHEKQANMLRLQNAITLFDFIDGTAMNSMYAGNIYRKLRENGITISTNDCLIASYCINNDYLLWAHDKDYYNVQKYFDLNFKYAD